MRNDLWTLTSDMMKRIAATMYVETDDGLHYIIRTLDENRTIIATVSKSYDDHAKYVKYQFRDSSRNHFTK